MNNTRNTTIRACEQAQRAAAKAHAAALRVEADLESGEPGTRALRDVWRAEDDADVAALTAQTAVALWLDEDANRECEEAAFAVAELAGGDAGGSAEWWRKAAAKIATQ